MSRPPEAGRASTGQKIEQAIEKAFDPLATALKRATTPPPKAAPGKPGLEISPLAVPFPTIPPIGGVEIATARARFHKHGPDHPVGFPFPLGGSTATRLGMALGGGGGSFAYQHVGEHWFMETALGVGMSPIVSGTFRGGFVF